MRLVEEKQQTDDIKSQTDPSVESTRQSQNLSVSKISSSHYDEEPTPVPVSENNMTKVTPSAADLEPRKLYVFARQANEASKFKGNSIRTSKYTPITFLPKSLFEQFRRVANFYFLLIAIISCSPVSPVAWYTNVVPLVFVVSVSLVKEFYEDSKRRKADDELNCTKVQILIGDTFQDCQWKDVQVGDIVKVQDGEQLPADLCLLSSSLNDGICYVETMNLDGETNLKLKKALEETWEYNSEATCATLTKNVIECEKPNNRLYTFTGNLIIGSTTHSVSPNQILLRGSSLRNTPSVIGIAVFTGHESKVMMNAMGAPSKRSSIERQLDKLIVFMFISQFTMCLVDAIGLPAVVSYDQWYLQLDQSVDNAIADEMFNPDNTSAVGALNFFTLLVLYSTLIPISLYVSIEIIKFFTVQQFINKDRNMYHKDSNTPALARTSNLNEELGQIQYIFSDKTGTLTQNLMEFFKCSIAGESYGQGVTEIQKANAKRTGKKLVEPEKSVDAVRERGFNFDDPALMQGRWQDHPKAEVHREFFRLLALCHTVIPEGPKEPDKIVYQAASPDEGALVAAAKCFGFFFHTRNIRSVVVREEYGPAGSRDIEYEILNTLEFNSTRKRQSVILKSQDGQIVLYCKGADNVIYERLSSVGNEYKHVTKKHLEDFSDDGLRTLCLAYKIIEPDEYTRWSAIFEEAKTSLVDREQKLDDAAELIETHMFLIGCTAIEDKLQDGVPHCIEKLAAAGIQIWVLTGDKVETAINIGFACSLLTQQQQLFVIDSENDKIQKAEAEGSEKYEQVLEAEVVRQLQEAFDWGRENTNMTDGAQQLAVVIDGKSLSVIWAKKEYREVFLELGLLAQAVVCCRVSPLQKAQVTTLVKEGANQVTLGIGDGANDVGMIQSAHIGVGISGQEGMQAVMASDFAIAQFRFLEELLLVHGRYSYVRIAKVIQYFFYKNTVYTFTQFWFNLFASYSGQRYYDDLYQTFYNLAFTSLPVLVVGLFDQDVSKHYCKAVPGLYHMGQEYQAFNPRQLAWWLATGLYQSVICFFLPVLALDPKGSNGDGLMLGMFAVGTAGYCCVIMTVNIRIAMAVSFFTWIHHLFIWGSIALWYLFILGYSGVGPGKLAFGPLSDDADTTYYLIYQLFDTPGFWLVIIITPLLALLPDLLCAAYQRTLHPYDYHIIQEVAQREKDGKTKLVEDDAGTELTTFGDGQP